MIIRELQSHFETVEMVRFMTYFGEMADSKRILIKATGKRTGSSHADAEQSLINENFSLAPAIAA
jgi:sulfur relay (sulfurtransferase) DsrC/TusE family protein